VPEIIEAVYGTSVVDGTPLTAYGVAVENGRRYYTTDPHFRGEWYQVRNQAVAVRNKTVVKLKGLLWEIREKAQVEAAKADLEATKGELRSLQSREGWDELEYELRQKVEARTGYYSSVPSDLDGLKVWMSQTCALKLQVEAALTALAEARVQAERQSQKSAPVPKLAPGNKSLSPPPKSAAPAAPANGGGYTIADLTSKWGRRS
jgi:hypothetical protein